MTHYIASIVDLEDHKTFVVELGNAANEDDADLEIIRPDDVAQIQPFLKDDSKYKPLHSHIEHYNRRAAEIAKKTSKKSPNHVMVIKEINVIEPRPYIADFRHNIKKFYAELKAQRNVRKSPANSEINDADEYKGQTTPTNSSMGMEANDNEESDDDYNYEALRAEYYQQLDDAIKNNLTFNYTQKSEPEYSPKDALKNIVELKIPKNCSKEELSQFGLKAFQCLVFDYKNAKTSSIKKLLWRTWTVIKIWIFIYICVAIPCWCQRGH
ncbi:hypothetical protein PV327_000927 [Microctonus hyperodae]|uniref:Uncharacterized protein n=1 Tax=Microctonus hyperodae TaxID=165561 RepID=A0AA39G7I4_MICHY|nr:hypothetical protein PV327_000927 [Microctonus hyperodae]